MTANQLILSGNKQVSTPIMAASKPVLMATQASPSTQAVSANKQTLVTKSLHARAPNTGQCNSQGQPLGATNLSQQQLQRTLVKPVQLQQLQQCLAAQHKAAVGATAGSSQTRTQIQNQRNSTSGPSEDSL